MSLAQQSLSSEMHGKAFALFEHPEVQLSVFSLLRQFSKCSSPRSRGSISQDDASFSPAPERGER